MRSKDLKFIYNSKLFSVFIVLLGLIIFYNDTSVASTRELKNFVNNLGNKVISIIKREDLGKAEKKERLSKIFRKVVDTKWIGRFAMGRYWRISTKKQRDDFLKLYSTYLINTYVPSFEKFTGNGFLIKNIIETRNGEYLVQTEVNTDTGNKVRIDYMLIKKGTNKYIIFDIIAEGVSMISTQRSEFRSIISNSGVQGLINHLRAKIK